MGLELKAENNIAPINDQLMELIPPDSKIIEFGCGKGDLLFKLSKKIKYGLGIDKSRGLIENAIRRKEKEHILNIDFVSKELGKNYKNTEIFDFFVASLFFHVIPRADAIFLLNTMKTVTPTLLICGISRPEKWREKAFFWFDQKITSHYKNFKAYKNAGYMEGLFEASNLIPLVYNTSIPFIKIYKIERPPIISEILG